MSCNGIKNNSVFGPTQQYIKYWNGSVIAVEGPNTMEKLMLDQLRIPYQQILKSRIILKPNTANYLLNFLGLGDNATYLCVTAQYDPKSKILPDNYVTWSFADDVSKEYTFAQILTLSGNSEHRIQQMYLTNPSATYSISLDVMVAIIDDQDSYFEGNQLTISNLEHTDIVTRVTGESISILSGGVSVAVIQLASINDITRYGAKLVITLQSSGDINLVFKDVANALQGQSIINWLMEDPTRTTVGLSPREDIIPPIVYFTNNVSSPTQSGGVNSYDNGTVLFGPSFSLSSYTASIINKSDLIYQMVGSASDNRDGLLSLTNSNITITTYSGVSVSDIYTTGMSYSISFDLSDIAGNVVDPALKVYFDVNS